MDRLHPKPGGSKPSAPLPQQPPRPDDDEKLVGSAVDEVLARILLRLQAEPRPMPSSPGAMVGGRLIGGRF